MEREYIGVDLHKVFFQVCAVDAAGIRQWEGRFPRTAAGIGEFLTRCDAERAVAVEACGPTWAFVDAVQPSGARVCVVDPRKTRLKAGYAAKTDRLDARRLADALRRDSVVSIYVPPPAIRELRERCRVLGNRLRLGHHRNHRMAVEEDLVEHQRRATCATSRWVANGRSRAATIAPPNVRPESGPLMPSAGIATVRTRGARSCILASIMRGKEDRTEWPSSRTRIARRRSEHR